MPLQKIALQKVQNGGYKNGEYFKGANHGVGRQKKRWR